MRIGLVSHTSKNTYHLSDLIYKVEEIFQEELADFDASDILDSFVIGVNLSEFESSDKLVTSFRNYKEEKTFEFTLNLKVEKYINNDLTQFKSNFFEDFKIGALDVFEKKIKNKDFGELIIAFCEKALLGKSSQDIQALFERINKSLLKNTKNNIKQEYSELSEHEFWELIEKSFTANLNFKQGVDLLENNLSKKDDNFIISFQITLRKLIHKLGSEFVIDKAKKANDYVTDDSFLYLRSKLITKGKILFKEIEFEVKDIPSNIFKFDGGEEFLYSADNAINFKYSDSYDSDFPSHIADKIYGPLL